MEQMTSHDDHVVVGLTSRYAEAPKKKPVDYQGSYFGVFATLQLWRALDYSGTDLAQPVIRLDAVQHKHLGSGVYVLKEPWSEITDLFLVRSTDHTSDLSSAVLTPGDDPITVRDRRLQKRMLQNESWMYGWGPPPAT